MRYSDTNSKLLHEAPVKLLTKLHVSVVIWNSMQCHVVHLCFGRYEMVCIIFVSLQPPTLTPEAERLRHAFSTLSLSLPIPTPPTAHHDNALEFSSKSDHSKSKNAGLDAIVLQTR